MTTTVVIRSNAATVSDVLVRDLGEFIPSGGTSVSYTNRAAIANIAVSVDVRTLATDDAFGANNSTLIINDGTNDIAQADIDAFLDNAPSNGDDTPFGFLQRDEDGNPPPLDRSIATATATTTTTSTTYVLTNSMTLTPSAGTYMVWFSGSVTNGTNDVNIDMSIFAGGVQDAASERTCRTLQLSSFAIDGQTIIPFCCVAEVTVNGSQDIEGRWKTSAGTSQMFERTLLIVRSA